jgi:hypothetical protein
MHPSSGFAMSEAEFEQVLSSMLGKGWPADVIDDIRADHKERMERTYILAINDAAAYLGLSRSWSSNWSRQASSDCSPFAPTYRDEKPAKRIPAKDVAALR